MRVGLIQLSSSDDPLENLSVTRSYVTEAAVAGADLIVTPEVTNCVSTSRARQNQVLRLEKDEISLTTLRSDARKLGKWILIGSLAIKTDDPQGRFSNRSFLIGPSGQIHARYDKIHMFDVRISEDESYRESAGYRPGDTLALAQTPLAQIGMTICYDLRFPALFQALAQAGAQIITVPSAFSPVTGAAHWETLLRARAIETGAYILAPAQCGTHKSRQGPSRKTYGHSMVVAPWGEVVAQAGETPGVLLADIDLTQVELAITPIPALSHGRPYESPG